MFQGKFAILTPALMGYGALFIISVELPDLEADLRGGKRNLMVRAGRRVGVLAALMATIFTSAYFLALSILLPEQEYLPWLLLFSLIPLGAALVGALAEQDDLRRTILQVKANFASLMAFLLLADAYLVISL
jgi:1,4-dihydroxy-2-naphthoate octaprenyltransferase